MTLRPARRLDPDALRRQVAVLAVLVWFPGEAPEPIGAGAASR